MILYPAIDLKDGNCVRLEQGHMDLATVFGTDPAAQARSFQDAGFKALHVVDLNGAFEGRPVNADAVSAIVGAVNVPVQLGGGIRNLQTVERWLDAGISRVILGTAAVRDPEMVRKACRMFPGGVVAGVDARNGKVAVQGWAETSEMPALELSHRMEEAGVAAIVYTDIARDGMLAGLNFDETLAIANAVSIPVIASGGLRNIEDIRTLLTPPYNTIAGAIAGRSLYDGRLDVAEALQLIADAARS